MISDGVIFGNKDGDKLVLKARYPRLIFAIPGNFMVSPMFALGLYFSLFGVQLQATSKLFPGRNQYKHFG